MERNLPFPNISLDTSLTSFHSQRVTSTEIISHKVNDNYMLFSDKNATVSVWSCEQMVYKMFEFNYSKDYQISKEELLIPVAEKDK